MTRFQWSDGGCSCNRIPLYRYSMLIIISIIIIVNSEVRNVLLTGWLGLDFDLFF